MIKILNIRMYTKPLEKVIYEITENCTDSKKNFCVSATGAHGLITAYHDAKFKETLDRFFINLPDGMPSVWVGKAKGAKNMERCYGPDFFKNIIIESKNKNVNHFFCGGKEGVAEELKRVCEEKYGNKNIVGIYSPPFREIIDIELAELAQHINSLDTNIVWIGLSTPKQEIFASRLSKFTNVNFICTVGAAFDFHTDKVKQAPAWVQKIGMEWFFRLMIEPKRLWKRYFEIVPLFIWYNLLELIRGEFFKTRIEE